MRGTVWAILLRAYVAGAPGGKSEHQASQLKAPLGWRKEKWNRAKGNFFRLHKRDRGYYMTIPCRIRKVDYKQQQSPLPVSLSPRALFINLNALLASRSICVSFLCTYQDKLAIHNAQFEGSRVRAFCDCLQTSTRVRVPRVHQRRSPTIHQTL